MNNHSTTANILKLAEEQTFLKPSDLREFGYPDFYLRYLEKQGVLKRIRHGLYCLADKSFGQYDSYIEVTQSIPQGVITLLSALDIHQVTTQNPWEVWIAVNQNQRKPNIENLPARLAWYSGDAFSEGIEIHSLFDVPVRAYCLEKTIADCFKYRNKIGIDVAIEALKDSWQAKKIKRDKLRYYAKICRVHNVMSPYLEILE